MHRGLGTGRMRVLGCWEGASVDQRHRLPRRMDTRTFFLRILALKMGILKPDS